MSNKPVRERQRRVVADAKLSNAWVDRELAGCEFKDARLGKRFRSLLEQLAASPGETIPLACQDWANTKAAYRFLDNDRVSEGEILAGTSPRPASALLRRTVRSWCCTTPPSSHLNARTLMRWGSRARPSQVRIETVHAAALHGVRDTDAFESCGDDRGIAAWTDGGQVLDARKILGNQRTQEEDQPDARPDRGEGKLPLAGESPAVDRTARRAYAMCSHR